MHICAKNEKNALEAKWLNGVHINIKLHSEHNKDCVFAYGEELLRIPLLNKASRCRRSVFSCCGAPCAPRLQSPLQIRHFQKAADASQNSLFSSASYLKREQLCV